MMIDVKWTDNVSCSRCRFRHPANLDCRGAERIAAKNRAEREPFAYREIEDQIGDRLLPVPHGKMEYVPLPEGSGALICSTVFQSMLIIGCENGAYVRTKAGTWEKINV